MNQQCHMSLMIIVTVVNLQSVLPNKPSYLFCCIYKDTFRNYDLFTKLIYTANHKNSGNMVQILYLDKVV